MSPSLMQPALLQRMRHLSGLYIESIKMKNEPHNESRGGIIIYRAEDNTIQLDVRMENETVRSKWLICLE